MSESSRDSGLADRGRSEAGEMPKRRGRLIGVGSWLDDVGLLLLRLHVGLAVGLGAGLAKIQQGFPTPNWFVEEVAGLGFPLPWVFAVLAVWSEFLGGLLVAVGLAARPSAFLVAFTMAVAAFVEKGAFPLLDLEMAQTLMWTYLMILLAGPGRLSIDAAIRRKVPSWIV